MSGFRFNPKDFFCSSGISVVFNLAKIKEEILTNVDDGTEKQILCLLDYCNKQIEQSNQLFDASLSQPKATTMNRPVCAVAPRPKSEAQRYWESLDKIDKMTSYKLNPSIIALFRQIAAKNGHKVPEITVDGFADQHNRQCSKFFHRSLDFLDCKWDTKKWDTQCVWLNPPFQDGIYDKLIDRIEVRRMQCLLVIPQNDKCTAVIKRANKLCKFQHHFKPCDGMFFGAKSLYKIPLDKPAWGIVVFFICYK